MGTCMQDACLVGPVSVGSMNEGSVKEMICEGLLNKVCVVVRGGRGEGEEKHCCISRSINVYSSLEADECSVDLANTGQCQHYLPPVLGILL